MEAITGDENGLIKLINFSQGNYLSYGKQSRSQGISSMAWITNSESINQHSSSHNKRSHRTDSDRHFAVLRCDGTIEAWSLHGGELKIECVHNLPSNPDTPLNGGSGYHMTVFGSNAVTVDDFGSVNINTFSQSNDQLCWRNTGQFNVRGPVSAIACSNPSTGVKSDGVLAFGGKENDAILYDAKTLQGIV